MESIDPPYRTPLWHITFEKKRCESLLVFRETARTNADMRDVTMLTLA